MLYALIVILAVGVLALIGATAHQRSLTASHRREIESKKNRPKDILAVRTAINQYGQPVTVIRDITDGGNIHFGERRYTVDSYSRKKEETK